MVDQLKRTFFVDSVTYRRQRLFRIDRFAALFIEVLQHYRNEHRYQLHEFVLMPDHFHLLITPAETCSLEKVIQFIKGGYSYRVKKELNSRLDIWQRSFMVHRVMDMRDYEQHKIYIHQNPVEARLVAKPEDWRYSSASKIIALDPPPSHFGG
jgi:putative transposase